MGRKILFITTDQQRYDTLGCNGGTVARTPVIDGLAAEGVRYERAHPQNVVCMPSRATMVTGQHVGTHGVWMNGVPLPEDAPSRGRRARATPATAPRSSARPTSSRSSTRFAALRGEPDRLAAARSARTAASTTSSSPPTAPSGCSTTPAGRAHRAPRGHRQVLSGARRRPRRQRDGRRRHRRPAGEGQPDPARVVPHRLGRRPHDRVARLARGRRRLVLLDELPRPPPPVGPAGVGGSAASTGATLDLPAGYPESQRRARGHPRRQAPPLAAWYDGELVGNYEAPAKWVPATLTADQVREVNALNAVECELIDEAIGRVLGRHRRRGLGRRRRRRVHHRPRRAAGRLRPAVQGPVPRRLR